MSIVAENVIAVGAENHPPMLERSQYDSWQSRMLLYIQVSEKPLVHQDVIQKDLPRQLPSTSMVKQNLLKAKRHLDNLDKVIKVRTKVTWQNEGLYREVYEMKAIFQQMKTEVDQCLMDKKYFELEKKELLIENDRLLEQIISQDIVCTIMHSYDDLVRYADIEKSFINEYNKFLELEAELLRKKDMIKKSEQVNISIVIASGMFQLDLQPIPYNLWNNKETHVDYLNITKEHADTLREIVKQARASEPLDNMFEYACKYAKRTQELLVFVSASCPSS
uniref:Integrase, catalytic region, zinc finger, CCHC-type, peptidase aspartic, catalytic n=1 Tax=Tanacetum cinerariifolium TaxID=118510 RepID=A0A6L2NR15_TANCI|nr:hypothetical protein [Tanacetum cinerariifolium]